MSLALGVTRPPGIASILSGLEPAQREAVLADEPVVCVLAGAGTGKTRVLTLRVVRRVLDETAHPSHVLVCTFSRKAADELRDRLWSAGVGREVRAGTFHRTALRLISHHRHDRGLSSPAIMADRRPLLAELLEPGSPSRGAARSARRTATRIGSRHRGDVSRLDAEIGWAKSRLVAPAGYEDAARRAGRRPSMVPARVAELYGRYEDARRRRGVLDLDDLLWHGGDLLEEDDAFARAIRWWHRHLFVDEMQDLNEAQYRLLRLLVGEQPDLFVVGDPNQSVYGWNGADPELLQRVTEEFAGTRVVRLETNHRCAPPVVRISSAVLGRDDPPPSARPDGPLPLVACLAHDEEEARWVARRVWLARRPGRRWASIAVLARTNAQLDRIGAALRASHVPHRVSGADLAPASDVRDAPDSPDSPDDSGDDSDDNIDDHGDLDDRGDGANRTGTAAEATDLGAASDVDDDAVTLSTFHRAKGLQWRTVFVVGVSDGLVPIASARSRAAKAEERRLFYVALTRAEEELTCSWALRTDADDRAEADDPAGADDRAGAAPVTARRPSPWLAQVEEALRQIREEAGEADPARVTEHLAQMRELLGAPSPGPDGQTA